MGHHKKKKKHKSKHKRRSSSSSDSPDEPPIKKVIIGPSLPTDFPIHTGSAPAPPPAPAVASTSSQSDSYGPQLPPHLSGPQLPPHLIKPKVNVEETQSSKPDQEDEDIDIGNIIGPLPADLQSSSRAQQALDERAEMLKYEFLLKDTGDDITQRETWMTELPPEKAKYCGLGARKFRTTTNFGDPKNRALWTETPLDKNKSQQQDPAEDTETFEELVVEQRNKIMDQIVKKNREKKEQKSLLEIHREKLKKKNKEKSKDGKQERRPFDRDVDLEVNKFDEAQKKSMLKRAQLLDDKFAHGKSKYL